MLRLTVQWRVSVFPNPQHGSLQRGEGSFEELGTRICQDAPEETKQGRKKNKQDEQPTNCFRYKTHRPATLWSQGLRHFLTINFTQICFLCSWISRRTLIKLQRRPGVSAAEDPQESPHLLKSIVLTEYFTVRVSISELYNEYRSLKQAKEAGRNDEVGRRADLSRCTAENPAKAVHCFFPPYLLSLCFLCLHIIICPASHPCRSQSVGGATWTAAHSRHHLRGSHPRTETTWKPLLNTMAWSLKATWYLWARWGTQYLHSGHNQNSILTGWVNGSVLAFSVNAAGLICVISLQERPATLKKSSFPGRVPLNSLKAAQLEQPCSPVTASVKSASSECSPLSPR